MQTRGSRLPTPDRDRDRDAAMWRVQVPTNWWVPVVGVVEPWPRRWLSCVHVLLAWRAGRRSPAGVGHAFAGAEQDSQFVARPRGADRTCVRGWPKARHPPVRASLVKP